jgi:hypothetical protein
MNTWMKLAVAAGIVTLLASTMGLSCDQDAQAVFRQSATHSIGEGVKQFLGGDPEQAVNTIVSATIDGLAAGIEQAGDGPGEDK